jgi:predicted Fe-Mo cluster-binding NifX family protein
MKIIVSAFSNSPDEMANPRFGRADWLILFNTEDKTEESFPNPAAAQSGGAGVAAAQFVVDHKADVVISGHFGPNAASVLAAAGIKMALFPDKQCTAKQLVSAYQQGELKEFSHV